VLFAFVVLGLVSSVPVTG